MNGGDRTKESRRTIDRQLQHVGDILSLVGDLEGLPVESASTAELTLHKDIS